MTRVKRTRRGDYLISLEAGERELLRALPAQLTELLAFGEEKGGADPSLQRLFPPAYTDEPELDLEYQRLMGEDLRQHHLEALAVMEATIDAERLAEDQLLAWLSSINDLRLVLGTRLDVSEDMGDVELDATDPRSGALALYGYLSWLEEHIIEALATAL